jgi:hypothetical protein
LLVFRELAARGQIHLRAVLFIIIYKQLVDDDVLST